MSQSKAKRKRNHLKRNGKGDPAIKRGVRPIISTHVRTTKTKKEKLDQIRKKERIDEK